MLRGCWESNGRVASAGGHVALLLDLGSLTAQVAQVVQLGAPHVATGHDLDLLDDRAVQREGALDANTEADLANRVGLADATTVTTDDHTLEDLDARARAFNDLDVNLDVVTGAECRDVIAQADLVDVVELVHVRFAFSSAPQVAHGSDARHGVLPGGRFVWGAPAIRHSLLSPCGRGTKPVQDARSQSATAGGSA